MITTMKDFVIDYNEMLLTKLQQEYSILLDDLRALSADEVIDRSYEKTIKQEFIFLCEETTLPQNEAEALYKTENALDTLYLGWLNADGGIHSMLESTYKSTAERKLKSTNITVSPTPVLPNELPDISGMIQTQ